MNSAVLKHMADTYEIFRGDRPDNYRETLNLCSELMDICVNSFHEMVQSGYQAYGDDGWKPSVRKFAAFVGSPPEDIFALPDDITFVHGVLPQVAERVDSDLVTRNLINRAVNDLAKDEDGLRMVDIIVSIYVYDQPHRQIGERYVSRRRPRGLSRQRILQIELDALSRIRDRIAA